MYTRLLVVIGVVAISAPLVAGDLPRSRKPRLELRVAPRMAFSPVLVLLTAELRSGDDIEEFYCPALGSRNEFTAGVGFQASNKVRVDVAYQFIDQNDRRGRVREIEPGETAAEVNTGLYKSRAHLFGTTITLQ